MTFTETRKIQERTIIKEWKLRSLLGRIIIGMSFRYPSENVSQVFRLCGI